MKSGLILENNDVIKSQYSWTVVTESSDKKEEWYKEGYSVY